IRSLEDHIKRFQWKIRFAKLESKRNAFISKRRVMRWKIGNSKNVLSLMKYTILKGYKIDSYELGARVDSIEYAKDITRLRHIINQLYPNDSIRPKLGPPGYTPPVNNNLDPHASTSNLQNQTQHQDPHFENNVINPTPTVVLHPHQSEDPHSTKMLQLFEERLKAIEGADYCDFNVANLCLIPNVVVPPKFKLPEFDKYKGNTCPKNHLTTYCRKMTSHAYDDKLLIHFIQESLMRGAVR
ncbi:hypothetical protein CR513_43313, partial [Mucuna pruriens]